MSQDSGKIVIAQQPSDAPPTRQAYVVGFTVSAILTVIAYLIVTEHWLRGQGALLVIGGLAIVQFIVQLLCFLHLGGEAKPRWKRLVFWLMVITVFIIVGGSVWIMDNLNSHMSPRATNQYLNSQDSL